MITVRCENCGNFGVRNNEYCSCPHGSFAKVKNGDHQMNPRFKKAMEEVFTKHDAAFRRLAQH
jgi:hypothetical protein